MNVLFISQCNKRALAETRRILDQFAERRGARTWQTPITQAGLDTVRKLLRASARKNTAVACHWIRGRDHSELLWIVGNARQFNAEGAVPTNTTERNILRAEAENDWHRAEDIRLLAQLAALLHDLGKASVAFQERLKGQRHERNLYRHEWVSLRLFLAFVGDDDDVGWLTRLAADTAGDDSAWTAPDRYLRDGVDGGIDRHPFRTLATRAPLAAAIGWLIVTHHRLPVVPVQRKDDAGQGWLGQRAPCFEQAWLQEPLPRVAHDWNEIDPRCTPAQARPYWQLAGDLPTGTPTWRAQARRVARALLDLQARREADWLDNPQIMHLARLCLMLADHHYSSLGLDKADRPVGERQRFLQTEQALFANTTHDQARRKVQNQSLLEHLLGVGHTASLMAHALPHFERHLPRLANHRGLRKRSADPRFAWQDKAFDAAAGLRTAAREDGAFIVNMASTGCGKTLANARILYALADPSLGLRISYALGLRTLTLQTGRSYRRDLHLKDDELAVLVGGAASRALFAYHEARAEAGGSASTQALIDEDSHVLYEGNVARHPLLSRALADPKIARLVSAPMLVCTVDHLAPATEALRAGRQIAPMLRLMSSDLVLDELDDYDLDDLPALTRLVHWAGMLGSRVVLSSATLPSALVEGMFLAYRAGRVQYARNRGEHTHAADALAVPCLWVDEFGKPQVQGCNSAAELAAAHGQFVSRRVARLEAAPPLRRARLLPLAMQSSAPERIRAEFAHAVRDACLALHRDHAEPDPSTGKRVSFGLVRMANVDPIFDVARALHTLGAPAGTHIHLCVYHARFPLLQRSAIEAMLDATLDRRDAQAVWQQPEVRGALDATGAEQDHLFIVLASPVCEVGRDWDADWAVAEPSSMRSLIQLAGRVQRHRRKPPAQPNLLILDSNLRHFEQRDSRAPVFTRPGFEKTTEDHRFLLASHSLSALLAPQDYETITARPRIQPRPEAELQPRQRWIDLEQARMRASMLPAPQAPARTSRRSAAPTVGLERDQAAAAWQYPQAALTGVLPQQQSFREDNARDVRLAWLPDEDEQELILHRVEDDPARRGQSLYVDAQEMLTRVGLESRERIGTWGNFDLLALLADQAEAQDLPLEQAARKFATVDAPRSSQGWRWHPWLGVARKR